MRKQKSLLSILMLALIFVFSAPLLACEDKQLDGLQNEYGIIVDGGGFTKGCILVSNEIDVSSDEGKAVFTAIAEQNYNKNGIVHIYDISVKKDGSEVQPKGKVKVTIPAPKEDSSEFVIFHIKSDGSVENLIPTKQDNKLIFETESFSYFVVAEKQETNKDVNEKTIVTIGSEYTPKAENVLVKAVKGSELVELTKDEDYTIDLGGLNFEVEGVYTITYTYTKDTTIKATLIVEVVAPKNYFRAYTKGNGYIYYNDIEQPNGYQAEMKQGEQVTLTAVAEEGYNFVNWINENEEVITTEATYTFTMVENKEVVVYAVFEENVIVVPDFTYQNSQNVDSLEHLYNGTAVFVARQDILVNGTSLRDLTDQEILDKISYKWVYANTDNFAPIGDDITIDGTAYTFGVNNRLVGDEFAGPCVVGDFEFVLYYDNVEQLRIPAKIQESTFKAITGIGDFTTNEGFGLFSELNYYAIVGIVDGRLYVMQMPKDCTTVENQTNVEAEARLVTAGNENEITLGNELDFVFTNFRYYYTEWKYYPSEEQIRENLLVDFGTGYYGSRLERDPDALDYLVYRNCWTSLSGDRITREKGTASQLTYGNLTKFADDGSVKIYAPRKGETENNALRLVKDGDKYVFTGKDVTTDTRESYPIFIYKWYVKQNEVYEFYGDLNKTYDGEATSFNIYEKALEVRTENEEDIYSLVKMEIVRFLFTDLKDNEIMVSNVQPDGTVTGPSEIGQYKLFIQLQEKGDDGVVWVTKAEIHTFEIFQAE